jgi:hypothetical protein
VVKVLAVLSPLLRKATSVVCNASNSPQNWATHKTTHLQIAQADPRPKFAKELFSWQPTSKIYTFVRNRNRFENEFRTIHR